MLALDAGARTGIVLGDSPLRIRKTSSAVVPSCDTVEVAADCSPTQVLIRENIDWCVGSTEMRKPRRVEHTLDLFRP